MTYHHPTPDDFAASGLHSTIGPIITMERKEGETVWSMVESHDIKVDQCPTICVINGEPILRNRWHEILDINDVVIFVSIPRGGLFRQLLTLVATIALAVIAPWAAGIIAGALGVTSSFGLALIQGGIVIAGSFLINAIANPKPEVDDSKVPSPTYSVNAQGNTARLYQPIPKLYGNHIIYPDFAANPYNEYVNNQQVIYQLFCQGLGKYETHKIRIEETDIWDETIGINPDFTQVEIEFLEPGEPVTLFHTRVQTSSEVNGIDMKYWVGSYNGLKFSPDGKITAADEDVFPSVVPGDKVTVSTGPFPGTYTVLAVATNNRWIQVNSSFTPETVSDAWVALAAETQWGNAYEACDSNTITNKLQFDFFCPKGLFYVLEEGDLVTNSVNVEVQAMLIDTAGLSLGAWTTIINKTFTHNASTPQRYTETAEVADGRYKCRVRRTNVETEDSVNVSTIQWAGMRAFIPDDNTYEDVSMVAIKMVTTGQLAAQASRKFNFIQTAIIPVYDSGTETWNDEPTRSIAWAAHDMITNTDYGAAFDPTTVDLDKLVYLDGVWTSREDYFDAVFDEVSSCWDAISSCLKAGRTLPVLIGGVLTFRRRENQIVPKGIFTPGNIVRGSFETEHILFTEDSADDIIIEFFDRRTWKLNEVRCVVPGSLSEKPEKQQAFGITDRLHAWREGIFAATFNAKNRVVAKFTTELDGRLLVRGDLVYAAHDMYEWGQTGEVEYYIPGTRELYLDRSLTVTPDSYIILRRRNGEGWGPVKIDQGSSNEIVVFDATDLTSVEGTQGSVADVWALDTDLIPTKFIIVEQTVDYKRFSVVSGAPKDDKVELVLIYDDPSVHTADEGTPPVETYPYEPGTPRPVIATLTGVKTAGSSMGAPDVKFDWTAAVPTATNGYTLQVSYDGYVWTTVYTGPLLTYTYAAFPGVLYYRVRGRSTIIGPWKSDSGTFGTPTLTPLPIATVDLFYSTAGVLRVEYSSSIRATEYQIELYSESVTDSLVFDVLEATYVEYGLFRLITEEEIVALGGPWKNVKVIVYGVNISGVGAGTADQLTGLGLSPITNLRFTTPYTGMDAYIAWDPHPQATSYRIYLYPYGSFPNPQTDFSTPDYSYYISGDVLVSILGPSALPVTSMQIGVQAVRGSLVSTIAFITGIASSSRVTEAGDVRVTEAGDIRITE